MGEARLDRTIRMLREAMDLSLFRRRLISSNVANAETPGYKALDVDFARQLKEASARYQEVRGAGLRRTSVKHLDPAAGRVRFHVTSNNDNRTGLRLDGNTVDLEYEMAKMAENQFRFHALTTAVNRVFSMLKDAVEGGGR